MQPQAAAMHTTTANQADEPTQNDELQFSSRERQTERLNRWMSNTKPSSRQLQELRLLGYRGELVSMLAASEILAELSSRKGGVK